MRRACKTLSLGLLVVVALAGAGCGGNDTTTQPPPERAQKLPRLPKHWQAHRDRSIGYAIGKPPGWQVTRTRTDRGMQAALIRSPDHLLAVTLVAARDPDALSVPLEQFATSALAALPGFRTRLEPSTPRRFLGTPLDAVQTVANGITNERGIHERATLLVLRRDGIVNYTVATVENARRSYSARDRAVALRMIRTLRDQPVG